MGASPVTGPTPNRGFEAAGLQKLGMALQALTDALPLVGATSEIGQAIMPMLTKLGKLLPPGSTSPAGQQNELRTAMMKNQQNQQMQQQLRQGGAAQQQPPAAA